MSGIVVIGMAGGCGVTTLACALALRMAQPGTPPLLLDAGVHGAGPSALWGIAPARAIDDLLPLGDGITADHLAHLTHRHPSGVDVVAGAAGPTGAVALGTAAAAAVAAHVAGRGQWVADAGMGDGPLARALAGVAARVVAVVPATVQGAARAGRMPHAASGGACTVVASALPGGHALSARSMRAALAGREILAMGRDDRGALDVAEGRAPRGRGLARTVGAVLEDA